MRPKWEARSGVRHMSHDPDAVWGIRSPLAASRSLDPRDAGVVLKAPEFGFGVTSLLIQLTSIYRVATALSNFTSRILVSILTVVFGNTTKIYDLMFVTI